MVVGAGLAGVSAAYYLTTKYGIGNVTIIDPYAPASVTSRFEQTLLITNFK
jgi:glycine/D-amino acid oxidase-like deaminating enzyme